jgi:hypothetical protein
VREKYSAMSLRIRYRHPQRPDEAGLALVLDQAKAAEVKEQLENRGFVIIDVTPAPVAKGHHQSD